MFLLKQKGIKIYFVFMFSFNHFKIISTHLGSSMCRQGQVGPFYQLFQHSFHTSKITKTYSIRI